MLGAADQLSHDASIRLWGQASASPCSQMAVRPTKIDARMGSRPSLVLVGAVCFDATCAAFPNSRHRTTGGAGLRYAQRSTPCRIFWREM